MEGFDAAAVCLQLSEAESPLNDQSANFAFLRESPRVLFAPCCPSHASFLLDCLLRRLLQEVDAASRSTSTILFSSSTIKRILLIAKEQNEPLLPSDLPDLVLLYAHKFWDFVVDVVAYDATEAFSLTLALHRQHCNECSRGDSACLWLARVAADLFHSNSRCKAVYKCMISLMRLSPSLCSPHFDAPFIVSLYDSLSNSSVGAALTELLMECLASGYGSWQQHVACISCLLHSSFPPRTGIYERLLPGAAREKRVGAPFLKLLLAHIKATPELSLEAVLSVSRFAISAVGGAEGEGEGKGGKKKGEEKTPTTTTWHSLISQDEMVSAVFHTDAQVRFSAWSLLVEHPKRTLAFSEEDCSLMGAFVETSMGEQRPAMRMKILAGVKKVLIRMVEVGERLLAKSCQEEERERDAKLAAYCGFIDTLVRLAFDSLVEHANFPRRLMALSILDLIYRQRVLEVPSKARLLTRLSLSAHLTPFSISALIERLDDAYEICQSLALNLLTAIHKASPLAVPLAELRSSTLQLLLSLSTHVTMATGYRIRFLTLIDEQETISLVSSWFLPLLSSRLSSASASLSSLIVEPLHPLLNALELILNEIGSHCSMQSLFVSSLLPLLHSISSVVSPLVHNLSPEGYLPAGFTLPGPAPSSSSSSSGVATTPSQMLLACAWRAHRHVSSMLGWAAKTLPYPSLLSEERLEGISQYFLEQLTACKHCGAFEGAVDGFEILAARQWSIGGEKRGGAPERWLSEAIAAIEGETGSLCLTRRSAGLPHLVVSLLVTEPEWSQSRLLLSTLSTLLSTQEKSLDTRVHSCNVAKAIVACSRLADRIQPALEMALLTAISGCSSPEWPARNSSSQLLSALISRVFGVPREGQKDLRPHHHNQMSAAEFFARFPSLVDFLQSTLRPCPSSEEFSLFPSLVILSHLFPSSASPLALAPFVPRVLTVLLSSRAEKVRALAAVALSTISTREDVSLLLSWVQSQSGRTMRQNEANAVLLMMASFLDRKRDEDYTEAEESMRAILRGWEEEGVTEQWCDWNVSQLLSLRLRLSLPLPRLHSLPPLHTLTLALRPLATGWIRHPERRQELPLTCAAFRHEIYRDLSLEEAADQTAIIDFLLPLLLKDLREEIKETNRLIILRLLMSAIREEKEGREKRREQIREAIEGMEMEQKRLPEESLLRAIRMRIGGEGERKKEEEAQGDAEWMQRCTTAEDDETKEWAMECAASQRGTTRPSVEDDSFEMLLEFLQDESSEIREKAAIVLGERRYGRGTKLSPFVLRITEGKRRERGEKTEKEQEEKEEERGMQLFEAMVDNPYKESRLIGELKYTTELIQRRMDVTY